ncbi:serine protease [Candidatus Parabeggiatoa sp. HSG14]|uniref:S1 family peptidase n=1 Tax=Candidatus Parabeggiatoa sp. HSG14 TaxID=3055593 RepID=UPI0025A76C76|nr:serine protease [Thiotrichales bacterium HSG14]
MIRLLIGLIFLIITQNSIGNSCSYPLNIEDIKKGVVHVVVSDGKTAGGEIGTGIIVDMKWQGVYIITASHVIKNNCDNKKYEISVEFKGLPWQTMEAKCLNHDKDTDLALLLVEEDCPSCNDLFKYLCTIPLQKSCNESLKDKKGFIVGHSDAQKWNKKDVKIVKEKTKALLFSKAPFNGDSGGPLVLHQNNCVIGMVRGKKGHTGDAVPVRDIVVFLEENGLEKQLSLEFSSTSSVVTPLSKYKVKLDDNPAIIAGICYGYSHKDYRRDICAKLILKVNPGKTPKNIQIGEFLNIPNTEECPIKNSRCKK